MKQSYLNTYYNPEWVYNEIKKYLALDEIYRIDVIKKWVSKYGEKEAEDKLWSYLEFRNLSNFLYIRKNYPNIKYILINFGSYNERGVRDNLCDKAVFYSKNNILSFSAHGENAGFDFDIYIKKDEQKKQARENPEKARQWIESNSEDH